ncbi:hypothetical protein PHLGIDRAFT_391621 [Phlebiopsis gigantea 11061_1 CR5-6]|uniref:Uncharacterized protein n=1 Tax=Phlebiopsis gigantea (strain 11061_1 CR5-6) TaxID=745531 RepID=A0A0C3NS89_PHLG1|nr:hypothetical protein PHLGIDRAFT_391621 [Phlebiopsis gigantea 11061_1 CR5-6]
MPTVPPRRCLRGVRAPGLSTLATSPTHGLRGGLTATVVPSGHHLGHGRSCRSHVAGDARSSPPNTQIRTKSNDMSITVRCACSASLLTITCCNSPS